MHLRNEFGSPVYVTNIGTDFDNAKAYVKTFFDRPDAQHALEKGGKSSRAYDDGYHLHQHEDMKELCDTVLRYADNVWIDYGLDTWYEPDFNTTWANEHLRGHETLSHNHSGSPIVAVYYMEVPENSGRLYFENPLEYHMCHEPRTSPHRRYHDPMPGDLVIFPGYLKHGTEVSQSDEPRTIISFNFEYVNRKPINISIT